MSYARETDEAGSWILIGKELIMKDFSSEPHNAKLPTKTLVVPRDIISLIVFDIPADAL